MEALDNLFSATDDFLGSLGTIRKVADSLSSPEALRPSQLPMTNAVCCASVVLLSGYFENFLKDIVKEFIEKVNSLSKPISEIPLDMIQKHYAGGSDALAWAVKLDKKVKSNIYSQDLTARLGSLGNSSGYTLAWESFANTRSNPSPDIVKDILQGLEIKKVWPEINDLYKSHGSLNSFLTSFIEMRNECAHTGRNTTPPSGMDIADYVDKFIALALGIDFLIGHQFEEYS
ncbi:HEPN domain-containing protein [Pseudomonas luteola]